MKQNIVLIGMSGCGKSTVGRLTAEKLGLGSREYEIVDLTK